MTMTLDGTSGLTTPGVVNTAGETIATTLAVTGASTFTGTGKFATTIGVGNATPAASGSGITFPATQSASSNANTLDDYEEGTWTPTFSSVTGSLTAYTSGGYYLKVGGLVTVYGWARITTAGTAGGAGILDLPFSASNITGYYRNQGTAHESQNTGNAYQFFTVSSSAVYMTTPTNGAITWTSGYTYPFQMTYQST